jgi:hypothetical protein
MATNPKYQAAIPPTGGGAVNKSLLRSAIALETPHVIADAGSWSDLVARDPSTGDLIIDIFYKGRVFHLDATDHTTIGDGVSALVTSDGYCYKLATNTDVFYYSVLDNNLTSPPSSPSLGDAHLIAPAATGAWAGKSNQIAIETARGWEYVNPATGRLIYVQSLDAYYHRKVDGSWATGFGNLTSGANTIPLSAIINAGKRVIVENQTTTSPPGSVSVGTAFIIGPSATGVWSGLDGKVALCEVANTFTVYTPGNGWAAYDKLQNTEFRFNGTGWVSSAGAIVGYAKQFTATGSTATGGSGNYTYSDTTAPTTAQSYIEDQVTITNYAARKTGARLRFEYYLGHFGSTGSWVAGLFRDGETNAIDWTVKGVSDVGGFNLVFDNVPASDALPHTYKVRLINTGAGLPTALGRRVFKLDEYA